MEVRHAEFTAWRRDLHAHPELAFAETRTAALVAERLESFGIEVHRGVDRTGVVGVGAHGARPETGVDPIRVGTQIASALQTNVSRNVAPVDTAVLSITQSHAGDAYNVIPQTARLSGTVRAFSNATMSMIGERMTRTAADVAEAMGARASVDVRVNFAPTVNDPAQAEFAASVCAERVGADNVQRDPPLIMASEDFSFMLERVPGCDLNIGNGDGESGCDVHNPAYDFNDAAIPLGARSSCARSSAGSRAAEAGSRAAEGGRQAGAAARAALPRRVRQLRPDAASPAGVSSTRRPSRTGIRSAGA